MNQSRQKWPVEKRQCGILGYVEVRALCQAGTPLREIAERARISYATAWSYLKDTGIKHPNAYGPRQ